MINFWLGWVVGLRILGVRLRIGLRILGGVVTHAIFQVAQYFSWLLNMCIRSCWAAKKDVQLNT